MDCRRGTTCRPAEGARAGRPVVVASGALAARGGRLLQGAVRARCGAGEKETSTHECTRTAATPVDA